MKTFALGIVLAFAATAAAADPIEGTWQTQPDDGAYAHVVVAPCGQAYCGTFQRTFRDSGEYKSPNLGKKVLIDMVPQGSGNYAGKVWRPSNDKLYIGKVSVAGNSMKMRGCVAGGLVCSSQTWARIN
jgi:uncharacterized protein (DUF2147 family)